MKKIITQVQSDSIYLDDLRGNEIVAYKCKGNTHAILRKIVSKNITIRTTIHNCSELKVGYGFLNLAYPDAAASFFSTDGFRQSIEKALNAGREIFVFDNEKDFCLAIVDNIF